MPFHQIMLAETNDDTRSLAQGIERNLLRSLAKENSQSLNSEMVLFVRDEALITIGGLIASTSYGWLLIKVLWVREEERCKGLGSRLVGRAEAEAVARGCHSVWLETSSAPARRFYEKLQFESFGVLTNLEKQHPSDHSRWFLKKQLQRLGNESESKPTNSEMPKR